MGAELAAAIAPWVVFGVAFCGILVYALRAGKRIARSSEDAEDANARADFNRKMADRSVAKDLEELAARARRRRERL
jgi:hypothetical protein